MHTQEIENNHTHKTVETDYHTNYIILYVTTTYNPIRILLQSGRVQNHRDYVIVNHRLTTQLPLLRNTSRIHLYKSQVDVSYVLGILMVGVV